MVLKFAADFVGLLHFGFILFVILGGLLVLRWPKLMLAHIPAVLWAVFIEISGGVCPLTPLENRLRYAAGDVGYTGGFIEQYLNPLMYPIGLTRFSQMALAGVVVVVNLAFYGLLLSRRSLGNDRDA